jgi:hypothetical protein
VAASRFLPSSAHPPASRKHDRIGRVCARGVVFVIACAGVQHVHAKSPHRSGVLSTLSAYFAASKSPLVPFFLPCVHDAAGHQDASSPSNSETGSGSHSQSPTALLGAQERAGKRRSRPTPTGCHDPISAGQSISQCTVQQIGRTRGRQTTHKPRAVARKRTKRCRKKPGFRRRAGPRPPARN